MRWNARLVDEEARRSERSSNPDLMDLCFQGKACWNKGVTPEYMAQARGLFERALALDAANFEAVVGTAAVDIALSSRFT